MKILTILLLTTISLHAESATYYANKFIGRPMANTEPYNPIQYTCAHGNIHQRPFQYPLGTVLRVTNPIDNRSVEVVVTDRHGGLTDIDLSFIAFTELFDFWYKQGRVDVIITEVKEDELFTK